MLDMIIKNGKVVLPDGPQAVEIGIKDGKISVIAEKIEEETKEMIDAAGQYVLPGMIDTHVHISEPGRTEWEGFETGSKSLAAGGVTSYVEMPLNALPATTNKEALDLKLEAAKTQNYVDYAFYGGLVPGNIDDLEDLHKAGVPAFKAFLSGVGSDIPGDFETADDYTLYKGMQKLAELDQILCLHAENKEITSKMEQEFIREGKLSACDYADARPIIAEVEAIERAILMAKETGCRLHIVHVSSSDAVQVIQQARKDGIDVTLESCPHYFAMSADDVDKIGAYAKCQPPIRRKEDHDRLWDELMNGNIDWLTSDHSPCTEDLKLDADNLFEAWGGISGAQNSVDLMFDLAVKERGMPVERFVELIATTPAKRFNIENKGKIAVMKDADIIFVDPEQSYTLEREDLYYKNKHSAYEGRTINCRVTKTILRGNVVFNLDQRIVGEPKGRIMHKAR